MRGVEVAGTESDGDMSECPRTLREAKEIVLRVLEQTALPLADFFHRAVSNSKAATGKPHRLRVLLFNVAGCPHDLLCKFEQLVRMLVRNSRTAMMELCAAAAEINDVQHFVELGGIARCLAIEATLSRLHLERHGKDVVKLYRGLRLTRGGSVSTARIDGKRAVMLTRHSAESHTTSILAARAFGRVVLRDTVPAFRVLICCKTNSAFLAYEHEFIVLRDPAVPDASTVAVRSPKGVKERLVTLILGGTVFAVCRGQV